MGKGGYRLSRGEGTKLPALCQALELLSAHRILGQAQGTTLNLAIRTRHLCAGGKKNSYPACHLKVTGQSPFQES